MSTNNSLYEIIKQIKNLFKNYSITDVATSLFISSLWLPNNGSTIKHQLSTAIFASIKPKGFNFIDEITNYTDFKYFCHKLYNLTPDFPTLEDYIPNFDWGSVKFHHDGINYKIFYETGISNIYDFLTAFQLLYVTLDQEYKQLSGRSPKLELQQCLNMQDRIIEKINTQPSEDKLVKISLGHIEVPSESFWLQTHKLYSENFSIDFSSFLGLNDYFIELGSVKEEDISGSDFGNKIFEGSLLPTYFIRNGNKYYPILARRFSNILIEKWSKIFSQYNTQIKKDKFSYKDILSIQVSNFLQVRFRKQDFYPIVSALYDDKKPHELIFSGYIIVEDKLVLFYIAKPYSTKEEIGRELNELEPKLKEAIDLISKEPATLALHLERKNVIYKPVAGNKKLKPQIFVILPQVTLEGFPIAVSKDFPGRIIFLDEFLGVMDEIESPKELSEFIDYLETIETRITIPLITFLDQYGSFKDSSGVLIRGANEPTDIMIDPFWGTDSRYKSLRSFWEIYPEINFMGHPKSWKIKQETPTRTRLSARSYLGCALYFKVQNTNIFLTSPLDCQSYEQGSMSNLLMECLEDYMARLIEIISDHCFFKSFNELEIIIFPDKLLSEEQFKHIRHLNPIDGYWKSDTGYPKPSCPGIRLVYNQENLLKAFQDSINNDIEIELLIEIIARLNNFCSDSNYKNYIEELKKQKGKKPRFKTIYQSKKVAFPEFISAEIPTIHDHKISRKIEAQIALTMGIKPGRYRLDKAKKIMNDLRRELVIYINKEISQYSYQENIKYLITRIDSLIDKFVLEEIVLKESIKHEVDFIREEHYSKSHADFTNLHKNYRYLLEKFVQLKPNGKKLLDGKSFRYLVAFVDKIREIYEASDIINYEIYPVGLEIDGDFIIQVKSKVDLEEMQRQYGNGQAKIDLGLIGNESDRVNSSIPIKQYLNDLDLAFKKDFGFCLKNMVNLLQIMSLWPEYSKNISEASYYYATIEEITDVAVKAIKGYDSSETEKILDFLTLKSEEMLTIIGSTKLAEDLPVWEHQKRPYRYLIRPLLFINGKYYWGPHSVNRSGKIWAIVPTNGTLPTNLAAPNINNLLRANQVVIEKNIEDKVLEIIKRYTSWADKVNYTRNTHPQSLGDYDVLAYIPEINILLNIECKDILGAFCLKDAKRIRDKIFRLEYEKGRKVKNPGNLLKVENREEYLKKNIDIFRERLKWPIKDNAKIISIYATRMDYWWTKFPPRSTTVEFMRVDFIGNYIKELTKQNVL